MATFSNGETITPSEGTTQATPVSYTAPEGSLATSGGEITAPAVPVVEEGGYRPAKLKKPKLAAKVTLKPAQVKAPVVRISKTIEEVIARIQALGIERQTVTTDGEEILKRHFKDGDITYDFETQLLNGRIGIPVNAPFLIEDNIGIMTTADETKLAIEQLKGKASGLRIINFQPHTIIQPGLKTLIDGDIQKLKLGMIF